MILDLNMTVAESVFSPGWTASPDAVLAASIFHYGEFSISQAKEHMAAAGIAVRL